MVSQFQPQKKNAVFAPLQFFLDDIRNDLIRELYRKFSELCNHEDIAARFP